MPVRITESYLRKVIRSELKEMMNDYNNPSSKIENFLALHKGKTITVGQIADQLGLTLDKLIEDLSDIQQYYDEYDAPSIRMLGSDRVKIDADFEPETNESPLAESKKKQLKVK